MRLIKNKEVDSRLRGNDKWEIASSLRSSQWVISTLMVDKNAFFIV